MRDYSEVTEDDLSRESARLARTAMELMERRGEDVTRVKLASELGVARSRIETVFPQESDLVDAIVAEWFAPKLALMDEVMASNLPPRRKMYEFFARRFVLMRDDFRANPHVFRLYIELGEELFENTRSYIDLADHYLCELIVEAQAEGAFAELAINDTLSIINQTVVCYVQPYLIAMLDERLTEAKLARIVDTLFDGLSGESRGAAPVAGLRIA